jgi:hypothetical protein
MDVSFYYQDIIVESRLLFPAALGRATCYEDRIVRHMVVKFSEGHCFIATQNTFSRYLPRGFLADNINPFIKDTECWRGAWV